jgi:hypothetical protein
MSSMIGIYSGGDPTSIGNLLTLIKAGCYTNVILWAAHVDAAGNINMNDDPVASGGVFNASAAAWAAQVVALKQNSTISRVELSIGGDSTSFANIKSLIAQYGTGSGNPLYQNLAVLQKTLDLDAVNYDDESEYDQQSSVQLAAMCVGLGMKVTMCPYTNQTYWVNLVDAINAAHAGAADGVYLQCYDGGSGNQPSQWNTAFQDTGLTIAPGLWATHQQHGACTTFTTASQAQVQMAAWARQSTLAGGFMFCGTDMISCPGGGTPAQYAQAISQGLNGSYNRMIAANGAKPVRVSYHDQQIGSGSSTVSANLVEVSGIYDIPPTIAEVAFSFSVRLLNDHSCAVDANLPDLLPNNPLELSGSYIVVLTLGRAGLLITAGEYRISITFTGPISQPTVVTGFQVGITGPDVAVSLGFVYV